MNRMISNAILGAVALLSLTACAPFGPVASPPVQTYVLSEAPVVSSPAVRLPLSLTVMPVVAVQGFETENMLYQNAPYVFSIFAKNTWLTPPAAMITNHLVASLQVGSLFQTVILGPSLANTPYTLSTRLLGLYQDFTVRPSVEVLSLEITLIDNRSNQVVADHCFTVRVAAPENNPQGGVKAANTALSEVLSQVVDYINQHEPVLGSEPQIGSQPNLR